MPQIEGLLNMGFTDENELGTVAEFTSRAELDVARGLLESEEIECLTPEEYKRAKAGSKLRLQVHSADAERAKELLVPVNDSQTAIEDDE
jgi:hypothetical protein